MLPSQKQLIQAELPGVRWGKLTRNSAYAANLASRRPPSISAWMPRNGSPLFNLSFLNYYQLEACGNYLIRLKIHLQLTEASTHANGLGAPLKCTSPPVNYIPLLRNQHLCGEAWSWCRITRYRANDNSPRILYQTFSTVRTVFYPILIVLVMEIRMPVRRLEAYYFH